MKQFDFHISLIICVNKRKQKYKSFEWNHPWSQLLLLVHLLFYFWFKLLEILSIIYFKTYAIMHWVTPSVCAQQRYNQSDQYSDSEPYACWYSCKYDRIWTFDSPAIGYIITPVTSISSWITSRNDPPKRCKSSTNKTLNPKQTKWKSCNNLFIPSYPFLNKISNKNLQ